MSYLHAFRTELHTVGMFFVRLYLFRSSTSLGWEEDSIDSYIRSARTAKRTNERTMCDAATTNPGFENSTTFWKSRHKNYTHTIPPPKR